MAAVLAASVGVMYTGRAMSFTGLRQRLHVGPGVHRAGQAMANDPFTVDIDNEHGIIKLVSQGQVRNIRLPNHPRRL